MVNQLKIKQAVILAGGLGTRLRPLTNDRPKPMVSVNGRPFLEYLVDLLRDNGVREVVMLLGYMPEKIIQHFWDGSRFGIKVKYSIGKIDDETGARIKQAEDFLDEHFLLLYCDNYWPINLAQMSDLYFSKKVAGMMTAYNNRDGGGEYGFDNNLSVSKESMVTNYLASGYSSESAYNAIDAGTFILNKEVLKLAPGYNFSFQKEILPKLVAAGQLAAFKMDHPYYSITSLEKLVLAERFLEPKKIIFLDRDGVINRKALASDYVKSVEEFQFIDGAVAAIKKAKNAGYKIFLVTNQAGIARGLMSESELHKIHQHMSSELAKADTMIDGIYFCPHGYDDACYCRKPNPGLFLRAARDNYLDLTRATYIGDSASDEAVASNIGCTFKLVSETRSLKNIVDEIIS